MKNPIHIFWFRRDLRMEGNTGLFYSLNAGLPVLPLFIFDTNILNELFHDDARVTFIHRQLEKINHKLGSSGSRLLVKYGEPLAVWTELLKDYEIAGVFANHDYEPYAIKRDNLIETFLKSRQVIFKTYKDQVIFEKDEVIKDDGKPYTVYTPYMNKWMNRFKENPLHTFNIDTHQGDFFKTSWGEIPSLTDIGFEASKVVVPEMRLDNKILANYEQTRNIPSLAGTSLAGPHLRFGTVGIRELVSRADECLNNTFLKELIWREFFMQVLYHFPFVAEKSFKPAYDHIQWINNEEQFQLWCDGKTGYPMVDAGMRELNETGFMHNRVRMVAASFLCKHLLIDWRWGEAYFARKLLDFELSSNNGNWQWAAGTGCDAAPYFRVFNPVEQLKKFDPELKYIRKWIPEYGSNAYPVPVVDHAFARNRAIQAYKQGLR